MICAMAWPVVLFIILIIALVVSTIIASSKAAKARREALESLANKLGFSFNHRDDSAVTHRLQAFSPFGSGKDRRGYNLLYGSFASDGRTFRIYMGDYRYTTSSGTGKDKRETTHRLSYLACELPLSLLVRLQIRREGIFDKIAGAIGFDDIDFESAEFSRTFHVKASDKKIAYDLLDPRMIDWYLTSDPPTLQIVADQLVLTRGGVWKPEAFEPHLEWLKQFISRWPEHLIQRVQTHDANRGTTV